MALFSSDGTISFSRSATASIAGRPNGKRVRHWGFFLSVARESREACAAEISRCTRHALTADQLDRSDSRVCLSHIVKDANGDFPPQAPGFFPAMIEGFNGRAECATLIGGERARRAVSRRQAATLLEGQARRAAEETVAAAEKMVARARKTLRKIDGDAAPRLRVLDESKVNESDDKRCGAVSTIQRNERGCAMYTDALRCSLVSMIAGGVSFRSATKIYRELMTTFVEPDLMKRLRLPSRFLLEQFVDEYAVKARLLGAREISNWNCAMLAHDGSTSRGQQLLGIMALGPIDPRTWQQKAIPVAIVPVGRSTAKEEANVIQSALEDCAQLCRDFPRFTNLAQVQYQNFNLALAE